MGNQKNTQNKFSLGDKGSLRDRGRGGGFGPGECVCKNCGYTAVHQLGIPCFSQTCPKCGGYMRRK